MSELTDLQTARARIATAMTEATLHPTHSTGGRSFDHDGHLRTLTESWDRINLQIIKLGGTQISRTQVLT